MDIVQFKSESISFKFHVINDMTKPCPTFGIPACGQEVVIWYEENDKRIAIIFDGSLMNMVIGDFLSEQNMPYEKLPSFIKESNEVSGWTAHDNFHGYELNTDDFLVAMELLLTTNTIEQWMTQENIEALKSLAFTAKSKHAPLKITCT
jgi:hypothetical protein